MPRNLRFLASFLVVATLASCGGGDGPATTSSGSSLSGVAAVGAPIASGTVDVRCAGGAALVTSTSVNGTWSVTLQGQVMPCLVSVSGGNLPPGQLLHSIAAAPGHLNVTPLTTLVLANAFGTVPSPQMPLPSLAELPGLLQAGQEKIRASLIEAGFTDVPADFLTVPFQPVAGDAYDDLLERLRESLEDAGVSYEDLVEEAASGDGEVPIPNTHVFTPEQLAAMPQLNKASLSATGDVLTMSLQAGSNPAGAFVGGGTGNKAVLQLPGLAGTKLAAFKSMSMDVKGPTRVGSLNVYTYVNFTVDLQCDGSPLPANATLADVRAKRRIVIYDPYVKYVQQASTPLSDSAFGTVSLDFATPGWRVSAGSPVGSGVAINPNYVGHETLETFDFATYPNACIVDGVTGDGGMFREAAADPACNTPSGLPGTAPASCGKPYSGVTIILGDSGTNVAASWQVKNIRFEAGTVRNFRFQ